MSEIPYTILLTSQQCGHCVHFRGEDGIPSSDKEWSPELIKKFLIGPNGRMRSEAVIEIHMSTMNPSSDNIVQVNEYTNCSNGLVRLSFTRRKGDLITYEYSVNNVIDPNLSSVMKNEFIYNNFLEWQSHNIPVRIKELIPHFPAWMFVAPSEWTRSIENNTPIYAHVSSCNTIVNRDGSYSVQNDNGNEDPNKTLDLVLNGTYKLHR